MNDFEVADVTARRAIDAAADEPLLAITGPAASGKTETLARRYVALLGRDSTLAIAATIVTAARSDAALLLAARPLGEPVVQYGPFVMNTRAEIEQAVEDFRSGRLGASAAH